MANIDTALVTCLALPWGSPRPQGSSVKISMYTGGKQGCHLLWVKRPVSSPLSPQFIPVHISPNKTCLWPESTQDCYLSSVSAGGASWSVDSVPRTLLWALLLDSPLVTVFPWGTGPLGPLTTQSPREHSLAAPCNTSLLTPL